MEVPPELMSAASSLLGPASVKRMAQVVPPPAVPAAAQAAAAKQEWEVSSDEFEEAMQDFERTDPQKGSAAFGPRPEDMTNNIGDEETQEESFNPAAHVEDPTEAQQKAARLEANCKALRQGLGTQHPDIERVARWCHKR